MTTPTTVPAAPAPAARASAPHPADHPDSPLWRLAARACGGFLIALGALAAVAWACGEEEYLQLAPSRPPLHYNGAIGFLLWGGAYLALTGGPPGTARVLAAALGALGAVVMVASAPGLGVRLDRWAVAPSGARVGYPAGVAPGVGFVYLAAGCALAALARRSAGAAATVLTAAVGALCLIGPVVVLSSAGAGDVFGRAAGPSLLGGIGVAVAGIVLLTAPLRRGATGLVPQHAVPVAVGLVGVVGTVALWAGLNADQTRRIHRQVQFETAYVQRVAQDRLSEEVGELLRLSAKVPGADPEQVKLDVGSYAGQTPACLGVARVGPNNDVTWIEGLPNQPRTLAGLGVDDTLGAAVRSGAVAVARPPRSNWRGLRVLLVFAPHRPGAPDGGLVVALRLQELFDTVVNANVSPGYGVAISDGDEALFARYGSDQAHRDRWGQTLPLALRDRNWRVAVWPTGDVLARESLSLPRLALLMGLVMTALLALAVHLAQTARRRTAALENEVREREQAQRALAQSEEKYRSLIENLGQGVFLQNRDHRFVAANPEFCRTVGRTEAEIIGATGADLFDPRRAAALAEEVRAVLAEGRGVESEDQVTTEGRQACVRRVLTPVRDASGRTTGVLGICWDVTEQRRLEAHVNQASKMDAIGQLAGGIAHDFNNLLTVILGNLELILGGGGEAPDRDRELVTSAREAAVRAAALTQRLLGFSRRHQLDWRPTDLNVLTTEVVALLRRTIDPLIRIETDLAPELWPVQADPTQLNQVLMNLCLNARDAITTAGRITIETACLTAEGDGTAGGVRGDCVRLRVTDTGSGMTPEVKARIYEPFFTTKEVGKGTGLGLPMVFAIVRQHKGWIECWSEPGRGTRFDIYLPRGEAAKAPPPADPKAPPAGTRRGTILVVDDEELIRKLAALALEARGYRVLQAADGQQAVDVYSAARDRIDMVLLDLTMPVLSGHEAFRHLLSLDPRVRVVFASGYAAEQLSDLEKERMAGFVKKPYRPNDLVLAVEEALQTRPPEDVAAPAPTPLPPSMSHFRVPSVA